MDTQFVVNASREHIIKERGKGMEELTFEGKIEDMAVKPKKPEGEFVKLKVSGKTFNFFDMGFYEQHKGLFKVGAEISIVYMVNTFTTEDGQTRTSNTANAIAFTGIKDAIGKPIPHPGTPIQSIPQKTIEVFKKEEDESSVESIMEKCLIKSFGILEKFDIPFTPEDIRTVAISLFIESCKRFK
jgi:hypothetical protein